ncbi:MAG: DUF3035 domain-containing protein, partial [Pseudomonadota bacterium]
MKFRAIHGLAILSAVVLSACEGARNADIGNEGPDEFLVLPTKPLETPEDLTVLPEPTPNGINRADQRPIEDAVVALGGRGDRLVPSGSIRSDEQALLAAASRFGVTQDIRQITAREDEQYRRQNGERILERAFGVDGYLRRYDRQRLDADAEL